MNTDTSIGAFDIGPAGTLDFDAGVDSSRTVTFLGSTGTLALGDEVFSSPGTFSATITGFAGNDVIDVPNASSLSSLSYAGNSTSGRLTFVATDGDMNTEDQVQFNGSYTTSSFITVPDGHGGTEILDPPTPSHDGSQPPLNVESLQVNGAPRFIGGTDAGGQSPKVGLADLTSGAPNGGDIALIGHHAHHAGSGRDDWTQAGSGALSSYPDPASNWSSVWVPLHGS